MTTSTAGHSRPGLPWNELRTPAAEFGVQLALAGLALAALGGQDPAGWSARTTAVLVLAAGTAAVVLLACGGWASDNRRAVRIAGALAFYAGAVLLPASVGVGATTGMWALTGSVALLGVVGFLALAVRASADRRGDRTAAVLVAVVVVTATAVSAALSAPALRLSPPESLLHAADLVVWSGTGAGALVMFIAGTVADRFLLRGTALAFATLAAANAVRLGVGEQAGAAAAAALQVAAVVMLLAVAVRFVRTEVGVLVVRRARLVDAEAAVAAAAARDRELRDLAVGLSGAARVLSRDGADLPPDDRRLLAAAGAEFERLRAMLGGGPGPAGAPVGPLLRDLAVVHRANGLDVRVEVDGDPGLQVEAGTLARILTTLLVNCAELAPGARVWLRADPDDGLLRVEVVDDGPGLAPETVAALVQRGGRGPRSAGPALGLALGAGLAEDDRMTITSVEPVDPGSGAGGCIAVLELPVVGGTTDGIDG